MALLIVKFRENELWSLIVNYLEVLSMRRRNFPARRELSSWSWWAGSGWKLFLRSWKSSLHYNFFLLPSSIEKKYIEEQPGDDTSIFVHRFFSFCFLSENQPVCYFIQWLAKSAFVSDQRLSLGENAHFQQWAFLAGLQDENNLYKNSSTGKDLKLMLKGEAIKHFRQLKFYDII